MSVSGAPAGDGSMALEVRGETLLLHPARALVWPARRTVIVADTHFGKSALFGRHGVAVPDGADAHDRQRLGALLAATGAERLVVLGDFLHAPLDPSSVEAHALDEWSARLAPARLVVIAGNHDRGATRLWRPAFEWRSADLVEPPFRLTHAADDSSRSDASYVLSGHVHPVARLAGGAPRIPVFWQRRRGLVLPSFGLFTGGYVVTPGTGDRIYAVGPERVVRFR